jgi:NADH-quinone oxidoreductase subunit A
MKFDVRYYLIAILFILFDLETALLFPWAATARELGTPVFVSITIFILELVLGLVYLWKKGALEWE